jgi:hypothetical protein
MIKQSNQSRQVEKYLYYHKNDGSASILGMMREERSLKFKFLTAHNRRDYEGQKGKSFNVNY